MQIGIDNKINFTSRNKTIRFANDIVRKVNLEFPRVSASMVDDFQSVKSNPNYQEFLWSKTLRLRRDREKVFMSRGGVFEKYKSLIDPIRKYKLGNCSESAHLTTLIARLNGVRNCYLARLYSPEGFDFDHTVLYVNDKKPYIMDAWLGFADFVPEAKLRYKNEFRKHFEFDLSDSEKIVFKKAKSLYSDFLSQELSESEMKSLQITFPNLVMKK